ncbi:MAG: hypothetical protein JW927_13560 [Deltaproteobacteria bacterium]|nr:hypothetical protein [Deltaproteobacteria bacterium]
MAVYADYKDDIGHTLLLSELDIEIPNGNGVHVTLVEALSSDKWIPNLSNTQFTGKTFHDMSTGHPEGYSGHANSVAQLFFGNTSSIAPGITQIDLYTAGYGSDHVYWPPPPWDFMGRGFLWAGWLYGPYPIQPLYNDPESPSCYSGNVSSPGRIANHSWVASSTSSEILRRIDWVIGRDEYMQAVASRATSALLSSAFNVVSVGLTTGESAAGTPAIDSDYTADRPLPNLVAPQSTLSSATPVVAAAMALLVETGSDPLLSNDSVEQWATNRDGEIVYNAERSEVIKAALMAGADRFTQNTSTTANIVDYRKDPYKTANGLDGRYGAGQVNIYNSYHIIANGEQNSDEDNSSRDGVISWEGFDFDPAFGIVGGNANRASYYFTSDAVHCRLAVSLVWNIKIDGGSCLNFNGDATLYDLNLYLYDVTDPESPRLIASSSGSATNTENLWVALEKDRNYKIEVLPGEGQGDFVWDYALGWRIITDGDRDNISDYWELENGLNPDDHFDADDDPDSDNLTNLEEFECNTSPINPDTDGDDYPDSMEISAGTNPSDPNDFPATAVPAFSIFSLCNIFFFMIFIAVKYSSSSWRHG